jgi:membrane-anchored glycerophosphoryl diester phosphodiesterase (GDPDase)
MVSSIQVARLLVHCVLIGSLTELLFSLCMRSVQAFLQMVDAITGGKVMSSMVIVLDLKVVWWVFFMVRKFFMSECT